MASPTGRWVQPLHVVAWVCGCSPSPPPPAHLVSTQQRVLLYLMAWRGRADGDLVTDAASVSSGHGAGPTRQPHLSSGLDVTRATPPPVNTHCIHHSGFDCQCGSLLQCKPMQTIAICQCRRQYEVRRCCVPVGNFSGGLVLCAAAAAAAACGVIHPTVSPSSWLVVDACSSTSWMTPSCI